jgi:acetyl esterase/lipase
MALRLPSYLHLSRAGCLTFLAISLVAGSAAPVRAAAAFDDLKDIEIGLSGTQMMHVELIRPTHSPFNPVPVVFIIHAGGWVGKNYAGGHGRGDLVAHGFAVVNIEYHPAGPGARWPVPLMDCLRAVRWMRANAAKYNVDARHFAVYGESAGAHLSACVAAYGDDPKFAEKENYPGVSAAVQAVVLGDGPMDILSTSKNHTGKLEWNLENLLGGNPTKAPEAWNEACLILHVTKNLPPYFIWHGDKDQVIPIEGTIRFVQALQQAGVPVEFITVKGGRHDAFTPADKAVPIDPDGRTIVNRMVAFLKKNLT